MLGRTDSSSGGPMRMTSNRTSRMQGEMHIARPDVENDRPARKTWRQKAGNDRDASDAGLQATRDGRCEGCVDTMSTESSFSMG